MVRTVAARALYPLLMVLALAACLAGLDGGQDPELVAVAITLVAMGVLAPLERLLPFREQWNHSLGDVRTDLVHMAVTMVAVPVTCLAAVQASFLWVAARVSAEQAHLALWPEGWPLAAQVCLALVVAELGTYWFHRIGHEVELVWRVHATHHSVERLYWLNTTRFHPIDAVISYGVVVVPLALLGAPTAALTVSSVLATVHALIQHANVDLRLGPLNWVMSGPELHRWHHSASLEQAMCNYGGTLIVWDVVFRTRYLPREPLAPEVLGIDDMAFPTGYLAQLASPFTYPALKSPAQHEPAREAEAG
jgi:sterol desaturase/sphingolipid hydroxylase (fatty acid hydroxylase superfamily)